MTIGTLLSAISIYTGTSVQHLINPTRRVPSAKPNTLTQKQFERDFKFVPNDLNNDLLMFDLETNPEYRTYDKLPENWYKQNYDHSWM